jgi:S1-C subfamily serine protease
LGGILDTMEESQNPPPNPSEAPTPETPPLETSKPAPAAPYWTAPPYNPTPYAAAGGPQPPYSSTAYPAAPGFQPPYDAAPTPAAAMPRRPRFVRRQVFAILLAMLVGFGGGALGSWSLARYAATAAHAPVASSGSAPSNAGSDPFFGGNPFSGLAPQAPAQPNQGGSGASADAQAIAARVEPAIVDINTVLQTASGTGEGAATGLIVSSGGEVLTNNHVVEGATSISVTIPGRSGSHAAQVLGVDPTADIALIKIAGVSGLPTVTFADSSRLQAGEAVVAIGNAGGRGGAPSVTSGTITALDQTITASDPGAIAEQLTGMIETDADIQPGDSGGALADSAGHVVGIITAGQVQRFRFSYQAAGLGYAVPVNGAQQIARQIRTGKSSGDVIVGPSGYLGVSVTDLDQQTADQLGVSSGVLVAGVQAGSPAARAGLVAGDVLTQVDGSAVDSVRALGNAIHPHAPGSHVQVTWVDSSGSHSATLTLTSGPPV